MKHRGYRVISWISAIVIVVGILIYDYDNKFKRINDFQIISGVIVGDSKVARGAHYIDYEFYADGVKYIGSASSKFCNNCGSCCRKGSLVKVRYERGNPSNSELMD